MEGRDEMKDYRLIPGIWFFALLLQHKTLIGFSLATRLATSRPLGERSEPCLAAKRPTVSDEVARGQPAPYEIRRRTFLKVYLETCHAMSKTRQPRSTLEMNGI